jgi:hypothetical protein
MRSLLVLALLGGTATAERLVIREPPLVYKCPKGRTWDAVTKCIAKHSTVKVVKTLPKAKLVHIGQPSTGRRDGGLYLYVERGGQWQLGGVYQMWSQHDVLGFQKQTVGAHTGYRIDLGQSMPTAVMIDDVTHATAVLRSSFSLFCSGLTHHCVTAMRSCEVYVRNQPRFVFRGTFEIDMQSINIKGDRTRTGPHCNAQQKVYLGWPTTR